MHERHKPTEHDGEVGGKPIFTPEGASFGIESIPGMPWRVSSADLLQVESNMMWRFVLFYQKMIYVPSNLTLLYQTSAAV